MSRYLMGSHEIRECLGGISRARAYQIMHTSDFPAPYDTLTLGMVWRKEDVEAWVAEHRAPIDSDRPAESDMPIDSDVSA
jgi:prophage regulatory protein